MIQLKSVALVSMTIISAMAILGCAGSSSNADEIRARANAGYADLDSEAAEKTSNMELPKEDALIVSAKDGELLLLQLSKQACPESNVLRGMGIATTPQEALALAQKEIAGQIQSSVTAVSKSHSVESRDASGRRSFEESYRVNASVKTQLVNAQNAKVAATLVQGAGYGVLACMSRTDAAKPFLNEYMVVKDSILLIAKEFEGSSHPLRKQELYQKELELFVNYQSAKGIVENLGIVLPNEDDLTMAHNIIQNGYASFKSSYSWYYQAEESSEYTDLLFARLSAKYPIKKASCEKGLLLFAKISTPACKDGSFGISCVADVDLSGASCQGESYFNLHALVKGSGRYDDAEAKERLKKYLTDDAWFDAFEGELNRWLLK